jgi:hypothetical protein
MGAVDVGVKDSNNADGMNAAEVLRVRIDQLYAYRICRDSLYYGPHDL